MDPMTIEEIDQRLGEIETRKKEIDAEFHGLPLPDERKEEWNELIRERDKKLAPLRKELVVRNAEVAERAKNEANREDEDTFQVQRPSATRAEDIYDLSQLRSNAFSDPRAAHRELRDRAMRSLEASSFPHPGITKERAQEHIASLLDGPDSPDVEGLEENPNAGALARRMLVTGSPTYKRAFGKYLAGRGMTSEEQRALSVGTGSAGGFALVYQLDPTVVPTSNFSVNPYRAIARIVPITGTNEWKAITSGAITAAYAAEATETSDNAPTLAQPDIIVERAQAFVPFSIELDQDWSQLQTEMAGLLSDAKDDLEATKFTTGAGHGSTEPKGLITAATATTTAGGSGAFAIADLYKVFEALPPRFRPRAQWIGNLFTYDKIRQFDTAGGSGVWVDGSYNTQTRGLGPGVGGAVAGTSGATGVPQLLGKPAYEATAMTGALTTGSKILAIGDFRYFVIVDRIGMNIEILPNLLGANRRPTGQRGLFAYWRNSSDVLSASAFQVLVTG